MSVSKTIVISCAGMGTRLGIGSTKALIDIDGKPLLIRQLELLKDYMDSDEERAILISSHISSDLESICDDLYMIHEGRILLHEETDVLLDSYGLLKVSPEQYRRLDQQFLLRVKRESYGYSCLTDQKQFYLENYPEIVVEKGSIDEVITMMVKGAEV